MEDVKTLVRDLRRMAAQTGHMSAACLGCGYERSCSVHGCRLCLEAAGTLERLNNFTDSEVLKLIRRISRLETQLKESETVRTDLAWKLISARRALQTESDSNGDAAYE